MYFAVGGVNLGAGDACRVYVSFDMANTLSDAVLDVGSQHSVLVGTTERFMAADQTSWGNTVDLVFEAVLNSQGARCVLHSAGVSGERNCNTCEASCGGYTCDEWVENRQLTCDELEVYDCDCSGCECRTPTTSTSTSTSVTTSTSTSMTTTTTTVDGCRNPCRGYTCDYFVDRGEYSCDKLEEYDCDCSGCHCGETSTTTNACQDTCFFFSCDFWETEDNTPCSCLLYTSPSPRDRG